MKLVHDATDSSQMLLPLIMLGLLANYNKFEFSNPYRLRLEDFVNDGIIKKVAQGVGAFSSSARDLYIEVQDDQPEGWNLAGTLNYLGFGVFNKVAKPTQVLTEEEVQKELANL